MLQLTEEMLSGMVQELFGTTTLERHGATLDFKRPLPARTTSPVRETAGIDLARAKERAARGTAAQGGRRRRAAVGGEARGRGVQELRRATLVQRRSCSTIPWRCRRSPSSSAATERVERWGALHPETRAGERFSELKIRGQRVASSSRRGCARRATRGAAAGRGLHRASIGMRPRAASGWG